MCMCVEVVAYPNTQLGNVQRVACGMRHVARSVIQRAAQCNKLLQAVTRHDVEYVAKAAKAATYA